MSNVRISSLPLKRLLAGDDLLVIVDTQFGAANYVNKRAKISDVANYVKNQLNISYIGSFNGGFLTSPTLLTDETFCLQTLLCENDARILLES